MVFALLLSCVTPEPEQVYSEPTVIDAPKLLRRMSIDLRGVLPSISELEEVETDSSRLHHYVQIWMTDTLFIERFVHLLNQQWHTRIDEYLVSYLEYPEVALYPKNEYPFERSVGEEPLRLMADIVFNDKPWTEIVTADYTMANEITGEIWPIDYPGGTGWKVSHYTDERPPAGVLSTNGLWWRYYSTRSNYNRARVAAMTRLLICEDYTTRSISFSQENGVTEVQDLETALRTNAYCMGCHSAIDPIAATLFGFWPANEYQVDEIHTYHPDREALGSDLMGVQPAWYGQPVYGLNELGQHIANDSRFSQCAVKTFAELYWRRATTEDDFEQLQLLHQSFVDANYSIKTLIAEIMQTPAYTAGYTETTTEETTNNPVRLLTPDQLASTIAALTSYTWTRDGFQQLDNDSVGFRNLAGGVDGHYITSPQTKSNLTRLLTIQRLAEAASQTVVAKDLYTESENRQLLKKITTESTPGNAEFDEQLQDLHFQFYGQRPTNEWLTLIGQLWHEIAQQEDIETAWSGVLTAMIRDIRFESY